ncbi:MAG: hypothetical protein ABL999_09315 [Pyrinomonadaceae bacterium]
MKILVTTLIIASAAGLAMAQEPAAKAPVEAGKIYAEGVKLFGEQAKEFEARAKVVGELASIQGYNLQKNSPLSAEEVNESVQTLADGNRIVRSSTSKFYRNSEGRIRREGKSATGGMFGTTFSFTPGVSIVNPVMGQKITLDSELKTARVLELAQAQKGLAIAGSRLTTADVGPEIIEARKAKELLAGKLLQNEVRVGVPLSIHPIGPGVATTIVGSGQNGLAYASSENSKYETRNEELGTRDFEGVSAEGTRRTTIIPAGAIGNDRPIEIVYERWFSKEIGMVVYSKNNDPRFGEQTYKLINIVRAEPDSSLFAVPTEYKKTTGNGTVYRVSSTSPATGKTAPTPRPVMVAAPAKAGKP